jgi:hypothetical protein
MIGGWHLQRMDGRRGQAKKRIRVGELEVKGME